MNINISKISFKIISLCATTIIYKNKEEQLYRKKIITQLILYLNVENKEKNI